MLRCSISGEANAPSTFVQLMKQLVLQDMNERDVIDFVDDLLIFSESEKQHLRWIASSNIRCSLSQVSVNG